MKHNLLTAANGLQTPIERSQRKSTTSSIHSTLLTSLLALFLLMVGNSAVWADWYITGEALPGLEEWVGKDWKVNALPLNTKLTDNTTYYYCFQNVSASNDNRYRLKITNGDWGTQRTADNTSEAKGNVDIVTGQSGDNQISFKMPFDGDVYVFFNDGASNNDEKVWIVAVPQNVAAAPNNSGNRRLKTDIMLSGSGWTSEGIKFSKNDAVPTYKHVTSYILPTKKNTETGAIRFEMYYDNETYISGKDASVRAALSTSTPQRIIYLWDGNKNGSSVNDRPTSTPGMTKDEAIKRGSARDVKTFRGELTNKELQDVITRLKLEEQLDEFDSKAKSIGKQKAWQLLDKIGDQLVVPLAVGAGSYGLRTAVKVATKKFDLDDNLDMLYKELFKRVNPDPKKK